jgi:hypothetical protein
MNAMETIDGEPCICIEYSSSQVRWNTHKLSSSLKFHQLVVFCSLKC